MFKLFCSRRQKIYEISQKAPSRKQIKLLSIGPKVSYTLPSILTASLIKKYT